MRVLVTGSRQALDHTEIYRQLDMHYFEWLKAAMPGATFTVIHGVAPGADTLASQWVYDRRSLAFPPAQEPHAAQWNKYGSLAGGIRNGEMVRSGVDLVLAFPVAGAKNAGTKNCMNQARLAGLKVEETWLDA